MDTAALVTAMTKASLDELDRAIKASDKAQFVPAFAHLTQACNAVIKAKAMRLSILKFRRPTCSRTRTFGRHLADRDSFKAGGQNAAE
jgi:hypothetical protein